MLLSVYQYRYYLLPTSSSITYHHLTMVYIASIYPTIIHLLSMYVCIYHMSIICHLCICFYLFAFICLLNFHFFLNQIIKNLMWLNINLLPYGSEVRSSLWLLRTIFDYSGIQLPFIVSWRPSAFLSHVIYRTDWLSLHPPFLCSLPTLLPLYPSLQPSFSVTYKEPTTINMVGNFYYWLVLNLD